VTNNIPNALLNKLASLLSPIVTKIFQHSIDRSQAPEDWKCGLICPIHKKGSASDPLNYRPIALTSVIGKHLEHIIAKQLREYLEDRNLLANEQHGFRRKRSCESQLTTTIHTINKLIDSGECVDAIVLDFSKAFDKVSHPKLIYKLKSLGINLQLIQWIEHWLDNRTQIVVVNGQTSTSAPTTSGVHQGSVLGPLLFLIYINDITRDMKHQVRLFADDTLLFGAVTEATSLQEDLDRLANWATTWQMEFNPKKCEIIHFNTSRKPRSIIHSYTLHGQTLKVSTSSRYLGVLVSSDIAWDQQVTAVTNKSSSTLGMLRRQLRGTNSRNRLTMYKTLIRPILDYASTAWSPHQVKQKNSLE